MDAAPRAHPRRSASPALSVTLELARALGGALLLPLRLADFLFRREALRDELRDSLERQHAGAAPRRAAARLPERPLRLFVSAAETSGESHALQILAALRARLAEAGGPQLECVGLGGERLRAAGVRTLGDTVAQATMGLAGALRRLPFYVGVLHAAAGELLACDAALLVDSPALHVPLGRMARRAGAPVVHFVAPQHWAWASWRTPGYRSAVDRTLALLPFEPDWFARRGIAVEHVGHPLLEALPAQVPPPEDPARDTLALLPGSRRSVIERNLPWMLGVLADLRERRPALRVVLAHSERAHEELLRERVRAAGAQAWVSLEFGRLHDSLSRARAAFAVSGTVLVDLVHQRVPGVVIYRMGGPASLGLYRRMVVAPYFALPNLVAGREVLPEFGFCGEGPRAEVRAALERALDDARTRRRAVADLGRVARALGPGGSCERAAQALLEVSAGVPR